jgi:hypothetical protein
MLMALKPSRIAPRIVFSRRYPDTRKYAGGQFGSQGTDLFKRFLLRLRTGLPIGRLLFLGWALRA